jgi:hypothetical protein
MLLPTPGLHASIRFLMIIDNSLELLTTFLKWGISIVTKTEMRLKPTMLETHMNLKWQLSLVFYSNI